MKALLISALFFISLSTMMSCTADHKTESSILISSDENIAIVVAPETDSLILWAAGELADGMSLILGKKISVEEGHQSAEIADKIIRITHKPTEAWEQYSLSIDQNTLSITGSDLRGTVYGIFDLAERMGISPWIWWADVAPTRKGKIRIDLPKEGILESPSVQFRGIFLNDEDWGLQPWAAQTFEPETGDIGPKTYEKIFQLLLRLKANIIWPAMHPSTKAFYSIPGNKEMAEKYSIYIGTSHAEPMLRNNVGEWDKETMGAYNYFTNSETIKKYWRDRIHEAKAGNVLITTGMRGVHDSKMEGAESVQEQVDMLAQILADQRQMLEEVYELPADQIHQVFIPYKEVLYLYDEGLEVPEDITLMWTDDNYGYIRRLSNPEEQKRIGGSGIYYHLSYWGRPHDYLWLSTMQPGLIWYEMTRAYQNGAQKIWIANVGDIKPAEYDMEFFLDLAWDVNSISADNIREHLEVWAEREFGPMVSTEISAIMDEYYRLAVLRKPEYMGWSQTEPNTETRQTAFTKSNGNEIQRRIDSYTELMNRVEKVAQDLLDIKQDAYYQLVAYPVIGAALMNHKFLYAHLSSIAESTEERQEYHDRAVEAYDQIKSITEQYNEDIADGKWNKMMSMAPRNLPAYQMPTYHLNTTASTADHGVREDRSIYINASKYQTTDASEQYEWKHIPGLGYSNESVSLYPFTQKKFETWPSLTYEVSIPDTGSYIIEVRCLPTHADDYSHQLSISMNQEASAPISLNTKGRSEDWKQNILQNHVKAIHKVKIKEVDHHELKLSVNQTGIVIDQIAIYPENQAPHYEIPK